MIQIVTDPQVPTVDLINWAIVRMPDEGISSPAELGPCQAFGILKDGEPVGVVIWNWYRQMQHGSDIRVIIVSDNPCWFLKGVLSELFRYPFERCGCTRITAVIKDGNTRSLKLCLGLGFRKEGTLRRAHNGRSNAIILGMLKDECKWLKSRSTESETNGQEKSFRTGSARSSSNSAGAGAGKQRGSARERTPKQREPVRA